MRRLLASEQTQTRKSLAKAVCFPPELLIKAGAVLHQEKLVHKLRSLATVLCHSSANSQRICILVLCSEHLLTYFLVA